MTRDSREFSAALVLGALGGAAVAMALRSGSSRGFGHGRSRAWSELLAGVDWREALADLRTTADPGLGSGLDVLHTASRRLRELGNQVAPGRR